MHKIAFMFSGQGAQYPGMMNDLLDNSEAEKTILKASNILKKDFVEMIKNGPEDDLNMTINTQPAMIACEIAAFNILKNNNIQPDYLVGFSLGEWAAIIAGQVIKYDVGIELIDKRANYMQCATPVGTGGMAVILGRSSDEVNNLCIESGDVFPSNYNCPGQITVAGTSEGINRLLKISDERGIVAKKLAVSIPSHCKLMQPAEEMLASELVNVDFEDAEVPIIMNVDALNIISSDKIKDNILKQLTNPVQFEKSIKLLLENDVDVFVEIGPGKTLSGLVKKIAKAYGKTPLVLTTDNKIMDTIAKLREGY